MKVKVISGVILGGQLRAVGEVVDVPAGKAYEAIALGRAVEYVEEAAVEVVDDEKPKKKRGRPRKDEQ
jgi:hypothetical protein